MLVCEYIIMILYHSKYCRNKSHIIASLTGLTNYKQHAHPLHRLILSIYTDTWHWSVHAYTERPASAAKPIPSPSLEPSSPAFWWCSGSCLPCLQPCLSPRLLAWFKACAHFYSQKNSFIVRSGLVVHSTRLVHVRAEQISRDWKSWV